MTELKTQHLAWHQSEQAITPVEIATHFASFEPNDEPVTSIGQSRLLGVLATSAAAFAEQLQDEHALAALSFIDPGGHMHYGMLPNLSTFDPIPEDPDTIGARMRIGDGPLIAAIGMVRLNDGLFVPAPTDALARTTIDDTVYRDVTAY